MLAASSSRFMSTSVRRTLPSARASLSRGIVWMVMGTLLAPRHGRALLADPGTRGSGPCLNPLGVLEAGEAVEAGAGGGASPVLHGAPAQPGRRKDGRPPAEPGAAGLPRRPGAARPSRQWLGARDEDPAAAMGTAGRVRQAVNPCWLRLCRLLLVHPVGRLLRLGGGSEDRAGIVCSGPRASAPGRRRGWAAADGRCRGRRGRSSPSARPRTPRLRKPRSRSGRRGRGRAGAGHPSVRRLVGEGGDVVGGVGERGERRQEDAVEVEAVVRVIRAFGGGDVATPR